MSVVEQVEGADDALVASWGVRAMKSVRVGSRRWSTFRPAYVTAVVATDAVVAFGFGAAASQLLQVGTPVVAGALAAVAFGAGVGMGGGYAPQRAAYGSSEYAAIGRGGLGLLVMLLGLTFFGVAQPPVVPAIVGVGAATVTAILLRAVARGVLGMLRTRGMAIAPTVVVADPARVADIARSFDDLRHGRRLVGAYAPNGATGTSVAGLEVLGAVEDAVAAVQSGAVDSVVVDPEILGEEGLRKFRWAVERTRVELLVSTGLREVLPGRLEMHVLSAAPVLGVKTTQSRWQRVAKTVFDRTAAAAGLLVLSPLILGAMALVRLTSPGPAIFRQQRIGIDGRPFMILKIRTMGVDAEQRKAELANEDGAGPLFKIQSDPRVTPIGRVLRRFSIDELPQLWNVVRGDMSLVGPRPPLPTEVMVYDSMAVHRLHVRPGLTGLWQVSGRSDLSWEQAVRLDLLYVDNWSVTLDLKILWRTARAVLESRGAY